MNTIIFRDLDRTYSDDFQINVSRYLDNLTEAIYYPEVNAWIIKSRYD